MFRNGFFLLVILYERLGGSTRIGSTGGIVWNSSKVLASMIANGRPRISSLDGSCSNDGEEDHSERYIVSQLLFLSLFLTQQAGAEAPLLLTPLI